MSNGFNPPLKLKEINDKFKKIKEITELDSGGQGAVFLGNHDMYGKVALKIYFPNHLLKIRAQREVEKLEEIRSDKIVELFDYGNVEIRNNNCFYSITKFIPGQNLRELINQEGKLKQSFVKKMIINLAKAIDCLWDNKIIHCDIKPNNIIYSDKKDFILIDLGIAKHLDKETITKYGMMMGTMGYIAPEQMTGRKNITLRADLYALGIVAFEMLTGKHPFNRNQFLIQTNEAPPVSNFIKIDSKLETIITKMLKNNSIDRPISGEEIINYL